VRSASLWDDDESRGGRGRRVAANAANVHAAPAQAFEHEIAEAVLAHVAEQRHGHAKFG
jgi:hypothetical protein